MSEWQECKLRYLTSKIGSGSTPRGGSNNYKAAGISLIRSQNVLDFSFTVSGLAFIDDEQANELKGVTVKENDILFNITGDSVARCCIVPSKYLPARVNQHVAIIRANDLSDYKFVFYYLQFIKPELLINAEIGATRNAITKVMLENLDIALPPLPEQRAIASILSSLDDKIDLLHRQNKTLEAMAEKLFRQWFVEEAGEDWEDVRITELYDIKDGTHDSPKQKTIGKPLITSKHILGNHLDIGNAYLISDEDFDKISRRSKVDKNDILISMIGTIGLIYLEQSNNIDYAIKNIGLFKKSQNIQWLAYTYFWLKSSLGRQFLDEHISGSTQEYVSLASFRSIIFNKPPSEKLYAFNKIANDYLSKIGINSAQILTLEKMRDTLLPKLMNGEVRVDYV